MRTVNWSVTEVDTPLVTPGETLGAWHFRASQSGVVVLENDNTTPSGSVSLTAGTYDLEAYRLDSTGATFGVVASLAGFVVEDIATTGLSAGVLTATLV